MAQAQSIETIRNLIGQADRYHSLLLGYVLQGFGDRGPEEVGHLIKDNVAYHSETLDNLDRMIQERDDLLYKQQRDLQAAIDEIQTLRESFGGPGLPNWDPDERPRLDPDPRFQTVPARILSRLNPVQTQRLAGWAYRFGETPESLIGTGMIDAYSDHVRDRLESGRFPKSLEAWADEVPIGDLLNSPIVIGDEIQPLDSADKPAIQYPDGSSIRYGETSETSDGDQTPGFIKGYSGPSDYYDPDPDRGQKPDPDEV